MPRPRKATTRIVSVAEPHGNRFRNRYRFDGELILESFATEGEARKGAADFARAHANASSPAIGELVDEYLRARILDGLQPNPAVDLSIRNILGRLYDLPVRQVTPAKVAAEYERWKSTPLRKKNRPPAVETRKLAIRQTRKFLEWCVAKGHLSRNPARGLVESGKSNRRKPQLRTLRDLHAFRDEAFARARRGDRAALGVLVGLYVGARPGEVRALQGWCVDIDRQLVIPGTKTDNAARSVRVLDAELWELLERARDESGPRGLLVPYSKGHLLNVVRRIAKAAGVESPDGNLTMQSLRGMAASIGTVGDAAAEVIAQLLGHSSSKTTRAHYATDESQRAAATQKAARKLGNETTGYRSQRELESLSPENETIN